MIRAYQPTDAEAVLALNEACVPEVGPMDAAKLADFVEWAPFLRVVDVDGTIAAFVIGLTDGAPYDSPNYAWFAGRHPAFAYVDRVAVEESQRGAGWGPALYREFEAWAKEAGKPMLCAEVNTEPPNPRSLRFHDLFGFDMVDQFEPHGTPEYRVGLMEKRL
ncbi:MAG: GNAT family N-acetyltransferase [Acidimicrobiia bacterium]|nr:GNAT family N-acetyltransferase [Acidimicrobiia bacterium]